MIQLIDLQRSYMVVGDVPILPEAEIETQGIEREEPRQHLRDNGQRVK
jgi:hypothetical protein